MAQYWSVNVPVYASSMRDLGIQEQALAAQNLKTAEENIDRWNAQQATANNIAAMQESRAMEAANAMSNRELAARELAQREADRRDRNLATMLGYWKDAREKAEGRQLTRETNLLSAQLERERLGAKEQDDNFKTLTQFADLGIYKSFKDVPPALLSTLTPAQTHQLTAIFAAANAQRTELENQGKAVLSEITRRQRSNLATKMQGPYWGKMTPEQKAYAQQAIDLNVSRLSPEDLNRMNPLTTTELADIGNQVKAVGKIPGGAAYIFGNRPSEGPAEIPVFNVKGKNMTFGTSTGKAMTDDVAAKLLMDALRDSKGDSLKAKEIVRTRAIQMGYDPSLPVIPRFGSAPITPTQALPSTPPPKAAPASTSATSTEAPVVETQYSKREDLMRQLALARSALPETMMRQYPGAVADFWRD